MVNGNLHKQATEDKMGLFGKREITWEEVLEFLKEHAHEINDVVAADLMKLVVKSKSNKVLFYRVEDDAV